MLLLLLLLCVVLQLRSQNSFVWACTALAIGCIGQAVFASVADSVVVGDGNRPRAIQCKRYLTGLLVIVIVLQCKQTLDA